LFAIGLASSRNAGLVFEFCTKSAIGFDSSHQALGLNVFLSEGICRAETPFFRPSSEKTNLIFVFWQDFEGPDGVNKWRKQPRFKGLYQPLDEVQICRILVNREIIEHILHTTRKKRFYGFFI